MRITQRQVALGMQIMNLHRGVSTIDTAVARGLLNTAQALRCLAALSRSEATRVRRGRVILVIR